MIKIFIAILSILLVLLLIDVPAAQAYGGCGYYAYGGADAFCRYEVNSLNGCPVYGYGCGYYRYTCPRASGCRGCRQIHHNRAGCICNRSRYRHRTDRFGPDWGRRGFGRHHRYYRPGRPGRCR